MTNNSADVDDRRIQRGAFLFGGVITALTGLMVLFWPGMSAAVIAAVIAVWAIAGGLVYLGIGIASKGLHTSSRFARIGLGVIFMLAGLIAFGNLGATASVLAVVVTITVGVVWVLEGISTFATLADSASRGWSVVYATVSMVAGISLLVSPLAGAATLWWLVGVALCVLGVLQIVRATRSNSATS